jgi:hypothetical protein
VTSIKGPAHLPLSPTPDTGPSGPDAIGHVAELPSAAEVTGAGAASSARGAGAADAIGALAQAIGDGSLTVEQAMERLVEHAVRGIDRHLTAPERAELIGLLREALADDPSLGELRASLR